MMEAPFVQVVQAEIERRSRAHGDPTWLGSIRAEGASFFREHGLPGKKDEAWKYTSLAALSAVPFEPVRPRAAVKAAELGAGPAHELRLVNGQLSIFGELPPGVEVSPLGEAIRCVPLLLEPYLGRLASPEHAFSAMSSALLRDGALVRVRAGAVIELPLSLGVIGMVGTRAAVDWPRILVLLEPGAELKLIEWHQRLGEERLLSASVAEIALGEGASLEHTRISFGDGQSFRVGVVAVRQAAGSRYSSRVFTFGGALSRLDLTVRLEGEDAGCTLEGLYHLLDHEVVDHHTVIDHRQAGSQSRQTYRGVVAEEGRAVFDGTIFVRRNAQRTTAHQENRHLVLSDGAVVDSKPRLEIDADQVTCGHGATIGRIEPDELFYLRSRGLSESQAQGLLVRAFAGEMLDRVPSEALRTVLERALDRRLATEAHEKHRS